jgi:putative hydrolase of the HAD superfamily
MKGIILDYGATVDSNGKHWSEVLWEGYCRVSLPVTKEQFRDAYVYTERYVALNPESISPEYNFFELMQVRVGIQFDYLVQHDALSEEILHTTLALISEGEMPILENMHDLTGHFVDVIAGYCYDYARRCTNEAIPLLEHFCQTYELAIVSNFYGNLRSVLRDFGLIRYFPHIIDSAEVGVRKPDPEIFRIALNEMKLPAEEVTVVGDSYRKDIEPALSLGCKAIWVKGSGWEQSDETIPFEPTITALVQLYDLL